MSGTSIGPRGRRGAVFAVFGGVFFAAGVIAGTSATSSYGYDCGSVFSPVPYSASTSVSANLVMLGCEDAIAGRGWMTWIALVLGVVLLVVGVVLLTRGRTVPLSVSGELAELDRLRASGVLSDEEFLSAKARVIGAPTTGAPSGSTDVGSVVAPEAATGETRRSRRDV